MLHIFYMENHKEPTKKLLEVKNQIHQDFRI